MSSYRQTTFRRFGIELFKRDGHTVVNTNGYRLCVLPFFFKNKVNFVRSNRSSAFSTSSSPILTSSTSASSSTPTSSTPSTSTPQAIASSYAASEDAGIPTPLNQPIFDILSRAKLLTTLSHENLVEFIAAQPSQKHHDQVLMITEDYETSLESLLKNGQAVLSHDQIQLYSYQILKALSYLHGRSITHRNLSVENIKIDSNNNIKLSNYALYYLSNQGENVSFPIGNLCNLSPQSLLRDLKGSPNPKCDVWALGCVLLQLAYGKCPWADRDPNVVINRLLHLSNLPASQRYNIDTHSFESVSAEKPLGTISSQMSNNSNMTNFLNNLSPPLNRLPEPLVELIRACLTPNSADRPSSADLLEHPYFYDIMGKDPYAPKYVERPSVKSLQLPDDLSSIKADSGHERSDLDIFSGAELYYLWRLAGGDLDKELVAQSLANSAPSVHKLPNFVPLVKSSHSMSNSLGDLMTSPICAKRTAGSEGSSTQSHDFKAILYNHRTCTLSIDSLVERIREAYEIKEELLSEDVGGDGYLFTRGTNKPASSSGDGSASLNSPQARNQDDELDYQIARLSAFHKALYQYVYEDAIQAQPQIIRMAKFGIPTILRGDIWAAILGVVHADAVSIYHSINLDVRGPNDKQFELDIPRCHQYHPLLSSPSGHAQLFRILKAWSLLNIEKGCYWQGLDNVASPFVVHCYHDEPMAFACLKSFVDKYLSILYVPNNYAALSEIMLTYTQLLSYHDPELSCHLINVQLEPNLYAIPWFITIFAHLLPLDKIDILWDTILLGPSSFPYFFAVSIMIQFRTSMLAKASLENCIKTISKISSCDIEQCVSDALDKFNNTPLSTTISKVVSHTDDELWWMQEVSMETRKLELFPRIGIHDVINNPNTKILDIRPASQFQQCYYPKSVNIIYHGQATPQSTPATSSAQGSYPAPPSSMQPSGQPSPAPQTKPSKPFNPAILEQYRGRPIVVIAPRGEGIEFCNQLVQWKFPFVALLNGGMDALIHGAQSLLVMNTNTNNGQ
ncbi:hypothetical protein SAMD00019534_001150 [Acytostelium subglobosum LB1]|uniref:hypothetical protein n=1 Tax=Acytostelium subglobosum LB1 TaxID=1410327 RepID=UPI0006448314|nr:hypothetical protein SAMD00019534_001150 [Acytostelium subglobosum LB1]GAM16940.1 hypothetical protein SAMD00019534_001150 [Acytostelium subglobosum LB1]|eukprot:XP_012759002.1 hypothetical protein SAMD00019534_001150 [Acytostelium subglobosum LB1]